MVDAETLPGADYGGEDFLRDLRGVELLAGVQANVAAAAVVLGPHLPEIGQQIAAPTAPGFGVLDHTGLGRGVRAVIDGVDPPALTAKFLDKPPVETLERSLAD